MKSVNITTLSNYANLAAGVYAITVVACCSTGAYDNSAKSSSVSYTKVAITSSAGGTNE